VHPTLDLPNHIAKPPVESALYASQLEFVVLHPANFFQNLLGAWPSVLEKGVIAEPFSKWARISRVDYRDVAEVAAIALTSDRLAYGTYELCADSRLNREDIAQIASEVLGRKIEAAEPAFDKWAAQAKLPFDDRKKRLLRKMYEFVGTHGELANSLTLRATLGREPRTMRQFIQELAGRAAAAAS
jgi:uncharacterized protein YbjT (DUF2867 family)